MIEQVDREERGGFYVVGVVSGLLGGRLQFVREVLEMVVKSLEFGLVLFLKCSVFPWCFECGSKMLKIRNKNKNKKKESKQTTKKENVEKKNNFENSPTVRFLARRAKSPWKHSWSPKFSFLFRLPFEIGIHRRQFWGPLHVYIYVY